LKDHKAVVEDGDVVMGNLIMVGRLKLSKRTHFHWFGGRKMAECESIVQVGGIGGGPDGNSRDWEAAGWLSKKGLGYKFGGRIESIK
jgi:hypothetical protein